MQQVQRVLTLVTNSYQELTKPTALSQKGGESGKDQDYSYAHCKSRW